MPGYQITVEAAGMSPTTVNMAFSDLPQPFVVGDRLDIETSRPGFQWWLTQDVRRNGVTVVYVTWAIDQALPPPLTLERTDPVCATRTDCLVSTVREVRATIGSTSIDIAPGSSGDIGDYRVFNYYATTGQVQNGGNCPADIVADMFQVAVVRRTPIDSSDAGSGDAGSDAH
jgi:hypothetical protein